MAGQSPEKMEGSMFSPRFRSAAEMAGWDEETLLLVVEDTPDRQIKHKRRTDLQFKTPPLSNSRRKRRVQRRSPASIPVTVLDLDVVDERPQKGSEKKKKEKEKSPSSCKKKEDSAAIPCMDKLREELSCAICLDICFEPSTTPCGHSFCKKCLRSAADKCGKRCPKCRQLISNGRSCTVNTVLWNTIQLLFPKEVEARKLSGTVDSQEPKGKSLATRNRNQSVCPLNDDLGTELESSARRRSNQNLRNRGIRPSGILTRRVNEDARNRVQRRELLAVQDEDAALAVRLQREEYMEAFRPSDEQPPQQRNSSTHLARANLRAIASRAMNMRVRGRQN
ncbi:hypothetical protein ACET3Z_002713 [Daucus carota]